MAELKKSVVAKVAADVKEAVKAVAPAAEAKKEEVKKEAPAKKAPAKKAAAPKKETVKKAAAPKKEAAKKEEVKKEAPAKKTPAKKAVAKVAEKVAAPKETIAIQFAGKDYASDAIIKLCKESYKATKNKAALKKINVYVNIDDSRAYYVVNDEFHGSVEI